MPHVKVKIPIRYRLWVFTFVTLSWCTGIAFYILSRWITIEGDFGPESHPIQYPLLKAHGASAFIMIITFGYLLASHIPAGWKSAKHRISGLSIVIAQVILIFTAYLLYYMSDEDLRGIVCIVHLGTGIAFPFLIAAHVVSGIRCKRQAQALRERKRHQSAF
ncbi:MAG: hypothetical protein ACI9FZ_000427 [Bacteroidia bacterium]|jgi:hypothetical protein